MKAFEDPTPRPPSQEELSDIAKFLREKRFKLEPDLKEKWLVGLRSGAYRQGVNFLRTNEPATRYCCMGVLGIAQGITPSTLNHRMRLSYIQDIPHILPKRVETFLASLNDEARWTFKQIADWVEENL